MYVVLCAYLDMYILQPPCMLYWTKIENLFYLLTLRGHQESEGDTGLRIFLLAWISLRSISSLTALKRPQEATQE